MCCAFSPLGLYVATGSRHGEVKLWSLQSSETKAFKVFREHQDAVYKCCFVQTTLDSPASILYSASGDGSVRSWEWENTRMGASARAPLMHSCTVRDMDSIVVADVGGAASSVRKRLATVCVDGSLHFWDACTHLKLHSVYLSKPFKPARGIDVLSSSSKALSYGPLTVVDFAQTGELCAAASSNGSFHILETAAMLRDAASVSSEIAIERSRKQTKDMHRERNTYICVEDVAGALEPPDGGAGSTQECNEAFAEYLKEYREQFMEPNIFQADKNDTCRQLREFDDPIDVAGYHVRSRYQSDRGSSINAATFANDSSGLFFTASDEGIIAAWSAVLKRPIYNIKLPDSVKTLQVHSAPNANESCPVSMHIIFASCSNRLLTIQVCGLVQMARMVHIVEQSGIQSSRGEISSKSDIWDELQGLFKQLKETQSVYKNLRNVGESPLSFCRMRYANEKTIALRERGISRKQLLRFVTHGGVAENFLRMLAAQHPDVSKTLLFENMERFSVSAKALCTMLAKLPFDHRDMLRCFSSASAGQDMEVLFALLNVQYVPNIIAYLKIECGLRELDDTKKGSIGMIPLSELKGRGNARATRTVDAAENGDTYFYCTSVVSSPEANCSSKSPMQKRETKEGSIVHFSPSKQLNRLKVVQREVMTGVESKLSASLYDAGSVRFPNFADPFASGPTPILISPPPDAKMNRSRVPKPVPSPKRPTFERKSANVSSQQHDFASSSPISSRPGRTLVIPKKLDLVESPDMSEKMSSFDQVKKALITLSNASSDSAHCLEDKQTVHEKAMKVSISESDSICCRNISAITSPLPARPSPAHGGKTTMKLRWGKKETLRVSSNDFASMEEKEPELTAQDAADDDDDDEQLLASLRVRSSAHASQPQLSPKKPLRAMFIPEPRSSIDELEDVLRVIRSGQVPGIDVAFAPAGHSKESMRAKKEPKQSKRRIRTKRSDTRSPKVDKIEVLYRHILFHDSIGTKRQKSGAGSGGKLAKSPVSGRLNLKPWLSNSPDAGSRDESVLDSLLMPLMTTP